MMRKMRKSPAFLRMPVRCLDSIVPSEACDGGRTLASPPTFSCRRQQDKHVSQRRHRKSYSRNARNTTSLR
eukprot:scaffold124217_cov32-Tisochrysis_lutea.AAC.1